MRCLEQNLTLLQLRDPKLAQLIASAIPIGLEVCTARDDSYNLSLQGKFFHSNYSPVKEAERIIANKRLDDVEVIFIYGIGLGYYYDVLVPWLRESIDRYIVFLEDDIRVLRRLFEMERANPLLQDSRVQVHYLKELSELELGAIVGSFPMTKVCITALDLYYRYKRDRLIKLQNIITSLSEQCRNIMIEYFSTSPGGDRDVFFNLYSNFMFLPEAYLGLKMVGSLKGVPAIICGAGPSLEKNVRLLHELGNKAVIFSGGFGIKTLQSYGIQPHFNVYVDPYANQEILARSNVLDFNILCAYSSRAYHGVLEESLGEKVFVSGCAGYPIAEWLEHHVRVNSNVRKKEGVAVINWTVDLAYLLGCDPIILMGLDLALKGNKYYLTDDEGLLKDCEALGSCSKNDLSSSSQQKNIQDPDCQVKYHNHLDFLLKQHRLSVSQWLESKKNETVKMKDIYGEDVVTFNKWINESMWLAQYARRHPDMNLINSTEGGIGVPGVENINLEDVIQNDLQREYDIVGCLHSVVQRAGKAPECDVMVSISLIDNSLCVMNDLCVTVQEFIEKALNRVNKGYAISEKEFMTKLQQFNESLEKELAYKAVLSLVMRIYDKKAFRKHREIVHNMQSIEKQKQLLELHKERIENIKFVIDRNIQAIAHARGGAN